MPPALSVTGPYASSATMRPVIESCAMTATPMPNRPEEWFASRVPNACELHADDRRDDRHAADRERIEEQILAGGRGSARYPEQHHRDGGHGIRLEQVGRHSGAVADVVAHVVGDDRRVARIVLRDARLDLADEIGPDVSGLRVDAAAESRE